MPSQDALDLLDHLLRMYHRETEWVEFKEAKNNFDSDDLGEYFSALSNEANLNDKPCGWLIFGVDNDGTVVGTKYREAPGKLDSLKNEIANHTSNQLSFLDIRIAHPSGKRVLLFQIPPALQGIPTSWKGHYYGRDGESRAALNMNEIERIRNQVACKDWSAGICSKATIDDLAPEAISKAREEFGKKYPAKSTDLTSWDDTTFLNKAKITIQGKVTNAAILLLGREESVTLISPSVAKITWLLRSNQNQDLDYEHFGPPFILNVSFLACGISSIGRCPAVRYSQLRSLGH